MEDEGIERKENGKEGRRKVKWKKQRKEGTEERKQGGTKEERGIEGKRQGREEGRWRKEGVNLTWEDSTRVNIYIRDICRRRKLPFALFVIAA